MPDPFQRLNGSSPMSIPSRRPTWPSLSADALATYTSSALKMLLPLVVTPLLARRLGPDAFGWMAVMLSLALTASLLVELGFGLSAAREATAADKEAQARIADRVLSTRFTTGTLLLAVSLGAANWLPFASEVALSASVAAAVLAFALGGQQTWYFQANGQLRLWSYIEICSTVIGFIAFAIFAHDISSGLWCYCAVYGIATLASMVVVRISLGRSSLSRARLIEGLRMTVHLAGFRLLTASYTAAVPAILALMLPMPAVAAFHVADRIVRAAAALLQPFTQIWFPRMCALAASDAKAFKTTIRTVLIRLGFASVIAAASLFLFAAPVAAAFAGPSLQVTTQSVLQVLVWLLIPLALSTSLGLLWLVPQRRETHFNFCIATGAMLGLGLLFTAPKYSGAVGAGWALLVGESCVTLAMFYFYARSGKQ